MTSEGLDLRTKEGQAELRRRGIRPIPDPDDLTRPYWAGARLHELRMQRCADCRRYQHPPSPRCLACGGEVAWAKLSGRGFIYSFVIVRHLLIPSFDEPYAVIQVKPIEADETALITSNIAGAALGDLYVGMPVEVAFQAVGERVTLPVFRPAAAAQLRSLGATPPAWRGEPLPQHPPAV